MNEAQFFAPWRGVAEFADDSRLTFDGFTEEQARAAMEAAQNEHGDIAWWDHVTDVNYTDGQYYKTLPQPPTVHVKDYSGYVGLLDENGNQKVGARNRKQWKRVLTAHGACGGFLRL